MTASDPQRRRKERGRSERGDGRELALLALCHLESYAPDERAEALTIFWENPPGAGQEGEGGPGEAPPIAAWIAQAPVHAFAERLVQAVIDDAATIDETIESTSRSWRIARMDRVDRNILRLVVVELGTVSDTPRGVILAEAVRLASRYGSERSAPFVNGLAESLARRLRPEARGGGGG